MKVGIVGCGRIAEYHLKFLVQRKDVEIVGLADKDLNRAKQMGERYGITNTFSSIDELIDSAVIDVLHILTPPQYHLEQAIKAIEKGIHILIEKPIALSFEDAQKIFDLAKKKNVKVCPDYIHLFNPIFLDAKVNIQKNNLGDLVHAECFMSIDSTGGDIREAIGIHWSYELPGGIMQNYITHPLYLIFDWIGQPKRFTTFSQKFGTFSQGLTDHIDVLVEGEKANGKITLTFAPKFENYYLKLFFDKGTVTVDFITQTVMIETVSNLPRSINRLLINLVRSQQLLGGSARNVFLFLRKKMVPYHGLKNLIEAFYGWIDDSRACPISEELALYVSYAEENILKQAGKVNFDNIPKISTQKNISKKEKILITGATGYLGTEVVRQLVDAGYYIRAYVRKTSHTETLEDMGVELVYGDIREAKILQEAAQGMDIIIHIAAALKGSVSFMLDSCVTGTTNVAEAARHAKVKRVIYISSFSVYEYFHVKDGTVLNEGSQLETQGEKRGIYSWAKRQAEDIALSNLSVYEPAWTILRPSMIFGNGRDLASLVGPKVGKFLISFGRSRKHIKLIHVKDVARAVLFVLKTDSTRNSIFNISHQDQITVNDIVRKCFLKSSLRKFHIVYVPYSVGLLGITVLNISKVLLGRGPSMNNVRLAYNCRDILADSQAIRNVTSWCPEEALLEQLTKEAGSLKVQ